MPSISAEQSADNLRVPPGFEDSIPPAAEYNEPEDIDPAVPEEQKLEISKVRQLLKRCYEEAPKTHMNPRIHSLIPMPWHLCRYDPGNKSLAYILHVEQGWTADLMKSIIGKAPIPFTVPPLDRRSYEINHWESANSF